MCNILKIMCKRMHSDYSSFNWFNHKLFTGNYWQYGIDNIAEYKFPCDKYKYKYIIYHRNYLKFNN